MPTGSQTIADNPGAIVRANINTELAALYGLSNNATAPATTCAYMLWHDTTTGILKQRDSANANWVALGSVDQTNKIWMQPAFGGNTTVASAATTDIGSVNHATISISGTTTITSFGTSMKAGQAKILDFPSGLTITYNGTSMITPGAANLVVGAGDIVLAICSGTGNYRIVPLLRATQSREVLQAARTYYVDNTNGNDANSGLAAGTGNAWKTLQKAINFVARNIDNAGFSVTIQLADGTYTGNAVCKAPWVGNGSVTINGNSGTPANVLISTTSATAFEVSQGAVVTIQNLKIQTTTSGSGMQSFQDGQIYFSNIVFGTCAGTHMVAIDRGLIWGQGNYSIVGGASSHMYAQSLSEIRVDGLTITSTGTLSFAPFAGAATLSYIEAVGNTYTGGTITGQRYSVSINSVIGTGGGGANYFPGNSAGATATGGLYS